MEQVETTFTRAFDELAFYDNSDGNGVLSDEELANVYNFGPSGRSVDWSFLNQTLQVSHREVPRHCLGSSWALSIR